MATRTVLRSTVESQPRKLHLSCGAPNRILITGCPALAGLFMVRIGGVQQKPISAASNSPYQPIPLLISWDSVQEELG